MAEVEEHLFVVDWTDDLDLEDSELEEILNDVTLEEEEEHFLFEYITREELLGVLERLSDPDCNVVDEAMVAKVVFASIKNNSLEIQVSSFLKIIQQSFSSFHDSIKIKKKQERAIRLERKFMEPSEERHLIEQKWDDIAGACGVYAKKHSSTVLEHILLHFWVVRQTVSKKPPLSDMGIRSSTDETELEAIRYHGGWAVKRARDLIKAIQDASGHLVLKQANNNSTEVLVDPKQALALITTLGVDEKVGDGYKFALHPEVAQFFVLLHDLADSYFSASLIDDQTIINCLKEMSVHKGLRVAWETICKKAFPIAVQVSVLQRICTMFMKSKQQIAREKLNLKPQKGSVALRQEIKQPKSKKNESTPAESTSCCTASSKTPDIIKQLQENFEKAEIVAQCLKEIGKTTDLQCFLNQLTGKQLTKLLKSLGQPALDGKGKAKQIAVLLPVITADMPLIIKYPEKLLQR